jgi:hypothetical protein
MPVTPVVVELLDAASEVTLSCRVSDLAATDYTVPSQAVTSWFATGPTAPYKVRISYRRVSTADLPLRQGGSAQVTLETAVCAEYPM